jgi:hypothetical protein
MARHDECPRCGTPAEEEIDYDVIGAPIFLCETCDAVWKVFPADQGAAAEGDVQDPPGTAGAVRNY